MKYILTTFLLIMVSIAAISQQFPIVAYYGIHTRYNTKQDFERFLNTGINISLWPYQNNNDAEKALQAADSFGVKLIISTPELYTNTQTTINRFKKYKSLFGYFLQDEPNVSKFKSLADLVSVIRKSDPSRFLYINLFPNYATGAQLGANRYEDYIRSFITTVNIPVISFDNYPIYSKKNIHPLWFKNLEQIMEACKEAKKTFWAFALTTDFGKYEKPSIEKLRLQVFANLAYGAKGIQYFTYWTIGNPHQNFGPSIVSATGAATSNYDIVKTVNKDVSFLGSFLLNSDLLEVYHSGGNTPIGAKAYNKLPANFKSITIGGNVILSDFFNKANGKCYLMVVNKSLENSIPIAYEGIKSLTLISNGTQKQTIKGQVSLLPGSALLFSSDNRFLQ